MAWERLKVEEGNCDREIYQVFETSISIFSCSY